jgi:hypothetical protein
MFNSDDRFTVNLSDVRHAEQNDERNAAIVLLILDVGLTHVLLATVIVGTRNHIGAKSSKLCHEVRLIGSAITKDSCDVCLVSQLPQPVQNFPSEVGKTK